MGCPHSVGEEKDSTLQMCVDYRRLNAVLQVGAYPTLCFDDLLDRLGNTKYITKLDLSCEY
jgi:hypothetical protein